MSRSCLFFSKAKESIIFAQYFDYNDVPTEHTPRVHDLLFEGPMCSWVPFPSEKC